MKKYALIFFISIVVFGIFYNVAMMTKANDIDRLEVDAINYQESTNKFQDDVKFQPRAYGVYLLQMKDPNIVSLYFGTARYAFTWEQMKSERVRKSLLRMGIETRVNSQGKLIFKWLDKRLELRYEE